MTSTQPAHNTRPWTGEGSPQ